MEQKLIIKNETNYNTKDIRKLFKECFKRRGLYRLYFTLDVKYRKRFLLGRASIGGNWMKILLNKPSEYRKKSEPKEVAQTIIHELEHTAGKRHKEFLDWHPDECEWATKFELRFNEPKPKPKRNLKEERYTHAKKMLEKHSKILKRENNIVKKWQKKVKYYEKKK